jgi:hypothetical protein
MAWEGGVDVCGTTREGLTAPNVILHVARIVHTPAGSAPSGMVLWQPDPAGSPSLAGFVSASNEVGSWFGPNIFAGTPFEDAPCLESRIEIRTDLPDGVAGRIEVGGHVLEVRLEGLGALEWMHREPTEATPFRQSGPEAAAVNVSFTVDGESVALNVPGTGVQGGPGAVWAPVGIYAR